METMEVDCCAAHHFPQPRRRILQPSSFLCPRCKCSACYPLHRKGFDWLMYLMELRPVRCLTCNRRFYARYSIDGDQLKVGPAHRPAASESNRAA
jgi:hypothetical protein